MGTNRVKYPLPPKKVLTDADFMDQPPKKVLTDADFGGEQSFDSGAPESPGHESSWSERLKAGVAGLGQGVSFGYAPSIAAAADPLTSKIAEGIRSLQGKPAIDLTSKDPYAKRRDDIGQEYQDARAGAPNWYMGGELAGSAATGAAIPGAIPTTLPGKVAAGVAGGALMSGLANPGDTPGQTDGPQTALRLKNARAGAFFGGALPLVGAGLAKGADVAGKLSKRLAFGALGPYAKAARQALQTDVTSYPPELDKLGEVMQQEGPLTGPKVDQASDIGRTMLDEGVIGPLPVSHEKLAERAQNIASQKGEQIESYLGDLQGSVEKMQANFKDQVMQAHNAKMADIDDKIRELLNKPVVDGPGRDHTLSQINDLVAQKKAAQDAIGQQIAGSATIGVDRKTIADQMRKELISPFTDVPGSEAHNATIKGLINQFEKSGDPQLIPVLQAEMTKRATGKTVNWNRFPLDTNEPAKQQVNRSLYSKLRQGVEDAATAAEQQVGGEPVGTFQRLKRSYGNLSKAGAIADQRAGHELAKSLILPGTGFAIGALVPHGEHDTIDDRLINGLEYATVLAAGRRIGKALPQVGAYYGGKAGLLMDKGASLINNSNPWGLGGIVAPARPYKESYNAKD